MKKSRQVLHSVWWGINTIRILFFNLVVLFLIGLLIWLWLGSGGPQVPKRAALVLRPAGTIVDQLDGDSRQQAINRLTGSSLAQTLTKDLIEAREADLAWLGDLWQHYLADVAGCRDLDPTELESLIRDLPQLVEQAGGDMAQLALDRKLVDQLVNPG